MMRAAPVEGCSRRVTYSSQPHTRTKSPLDAAYAAQERSIVSASRQVSIRFICCSSFPKLLFICIDGIPAHLFQNMGEIL